MLVSCNGVIDDEGVFTPSDFIAEIKEANLPCILLNEDSQPKLINAILIISRLVSIREPTLLLHSLIYQVQRFLISMTRMELLIFLQIKTSLLQALVEMLALTQIYSMD